MHTDATARETVMSVKNIRFSKTLISMLNGTQTFQNLGGGNYIIYAHSKHLKMLFYARTDQGYMIRYAQFKGLLWPAP